MRATQIATLRAIQAGADTVPALVLHLGLRWDQVSERLMRLVESKHLEGNLHVDGPVMRFHLTDKARSLLAERDGGSEYGLGYMQGKGAS